MEQNRAVNVDNHVEMPDVNLLRRIKVSHRFHPNHQSFLYTRYFTPKLKRFKSLTDMYIRRGCNNFASESELLYGKHFSYPILYGVKYGSDPSVCHNTIMDYCCQQSNSLSSSWSSSKGAKSKFGSSYCFDSCAIHAARSISTLDSCKQVAHAVFDCGTSSTVEAGPLEERTESQRAHEVCIASVKAVDRNGQMQGSGTKSNCDDIRAIQGYRLQAADDPQRFPSIEEEAGFSITVQLAIENLTRKSHLREITMSEEKTLNLNSTIVKAPPGE